MTPVEIIIYLVAIITAINPPSVSVVAMSIASLIGSGKHPKHAGAYTMLYAAGSFLAKLVIALAWLVILNQLSVGAVGYIGLALAVTLSIFGLLEVKDYFWYGKGLSFKLSKNSESKIHKWTKAHHGVARGLLLGFYTTFKLSHYTVVMMLTCILLVHLLTDRALLASILWPFWYSVPTMIIAALVASGASAHSITEWKEQTKHTMRLAIGLVYTIVGWVVLVVLAGGLKLV